MFQILNIYFHFDFYDFFLIESLLTAITVSVFNKMPVSTKSEKHHYRESRRRPHCLCNPKPCQIVPKILLKKGLFWKCFIYFKTKIHV